MTGTAIQPVARNALIERSRNASGAIIAATIAPLLVQGGVSALAAVTAALLAMVALRNDFAAVAAGLVAAALVRATGF